MPNPKKVLLVEDDQDDQSFFIEALQEINNVILYGVANNGVEALEQLETSVTLPDLIFMDINMPMMNGIECLAEIIKRPQVKNIPVIILSSCELEIGQANKFGAKAAIQKPINGNTLRTKIEAVINMDFGLSASIR